MVEMESKGNILMNKYDVGRLLGEGTYGKVYLGRNLKTGQSVAIKVINKARVSKVGHINQIKREIFVMRLVKHQNVTEIYEVMATKTKIYFVMEYAKGGELLHKITKGRVKENTARKYFQQLIFAVNFCHNRGVYHRDLKPENLLLGERRCLKVSDFGLSALLDSKRQDGLLHTACGTPSYVAPEVISKKGYDEAKADIWSCGVILFVLLAGYLPFDDSNLIEMYRKISRAEYKGPDWFSPQVRKLLSRMLDPNPKKRISIARIMESSWFRKGLDSKPGKNTAGDMEKRHTDTSAVLQHPGWYDAAETNLELARPTVLNAFDVISLSTGFDLSGLIVSDDLKDEVRFASTKSASATISEVEEIGCTLKLKVTKNEKGSLRLECTNQGGNWTLSIDVEIFEVTTSLHLVELKKYSGDTIEFQNKLKQGIRPALREIVLAWQGEKQHCFKL